MVVCFIAMFVFGVLGIFSATHRRIAFDAFDCVFRKVTFRKCNTGLDTKLKSAIVGHLLKFSPKAGRFTFKHFEFISWIFTALFIWSMVATAIAGYNFYAYGNCNGPLEDDKFCIFDPLGSHSKTSTGGECSVGPVDESALTLENVNTALFPVFNEGAKNKVLFIGCYSCEYSREAYENMKRLKERDDVEYIFAHFPVKEHAEEITRVANCVYLNDNEKLNDFNDIAFHKDIEDLADNEKVFDIVEDIGMNKSLIQECVDSEEMQNLYDKQIEEIKKTNIYGTPLVFVNGESVVGPKQYRVYSRLLK